MAWNNVSFLLLLVSWGGLFVVREANAASLAFVEINALEDSFKFVVLEDLQVGSPDPLRVSFTDRGVDPSDNNAFVNADLSVEGVMNWIVDEAVEAGTIVSYNGSTQSFDIGGSDIVDGIIVLDAAAGDQLYAFVREAGVNRYITAINFVNTGFESAPITFGDVIRGALPNDLSLGVTAVEVPNLGDLMKYNGLLSTAFKANYLIALHNPFNWISPASTPFDEQLVVLDESVRSPFVIPEVAFVLYNTDGNEFAFVVLNDLPIGTLMYFIDLPVLDGTNEVQFGEMQTGIEGVLTWFVRGDQPDEKGVKVKAGTVVHIKENQDITTGADVGNIAKISLNGVTGDSIITYVSSNGGATPDLFVGALNNVGAAGEFQTGPTLDEFKTGLPKGLEEGVSAVALPRKKNYVYNGAVTRGTVQQIKSAINNKDNWVGDDTIPQNFSAVFEIVDGAEEEDKKEFFEEDAFIYAIGGAVGLLVLIAFVALFRRPRKTQVNDDFEPAKDQGGSKPATTGLNDIESDRRSQKPSFKRGLSFGWFSAIYKAPGDRKSSKKQTWFSQTFGSAGRSKSRQLPDQESVEMFKRDSAYEDEMEA